MNELSKLRGLSPVSPASNRVWKAPKERRSEDRPPRKRKNKGPDYEDARDKADRADPLSRPDADAPEEVELPLEYGADGIKKRTRHKVDVEV
ncbi:MAG: hypothetical protein PVG49_01530 [Desulfobacteraceae bacterium]|jgi:hypothetical protein